MTSFLRKTLRRDLNLLKNRLRCFSSVNFTSDLAKTLHYGRDITGNPFSFSHDQFPHRELDDGIMSIIRENQNATNSLKSVISVDEECAIANILLIWEHYRYGAFRLDIKPYLKTLLKLGSTNKLTLREKYLGSALECWTRGDYNNAGELLEHYIQLIVGSNNETSTDVLILKLCQESYILAGNSSRALHCITRSGYNLMDDHLLYSDIMSMLATGYAECGYHKEAEIASRKVLELDNGRSAFNLRTLAGVLLQRGRGSETWALVHDYEEKHPEGGKVHMLYAGVCSKWMRGEVGAAAGYVRKLIDYIIENEDGNGLPRIGAEYVGLSLLMLDMSHILHEDLDSMAVRFAAHYGTVEERDSKLDPDDLDEGKRMLVLRGNTVGTAAMGALFSSASRRQFTIDAEDKKFTGELKVINNLFGWGNSSSSSSTTATTSTEKEGIKVRNVDDISEDICDRLYYDFLSQVKQLNDNEANEISSKSDILVPYLQIFRYFTDDHRMKGEGKKYQEKNDQIEENTVTEDIAYTTPLPPSTLPLTLALLQGIHHFDNAYYASARASLECLLPSWRELVPLGSGAGTRPGAIMHGCAARLTYQYLHTEALLRAGADAASITAEEIWKQQNDDDFWGNYEDEGDETGNSSSDAKNDYSYGEQNNLDLGPPPAWLLARLQLGERIVVAPSDAQAHWRLASLRDVIGPEELALESHRTAQQFGIGQGGFKKYLAYTLIH